jgi:hypothetical protein
MPDGQDFPGIPEIFLKVIKQDISQSGPEYQTENQVKIKVQELIEGKERGVLSRQLDLDQQIGEKKAEEIHQTIPSNLQRAERNQHRIYIGKGEHNLLSYCKLNIFEI